MLGQTIGNLVSDSENDKKVKRRGLSFDPFAGAQVRQKPGTLESIRDFATNTVFNVVDSALFGVPTGLMNKEVEQPKSFWEKPESSYGEAFDSLGIKPYESLTSAGRFGSGIGQALGFFIPYTKISKGTAFVQRAALGNFDNILGKAVKEAAGDINFKSVDSLTSIVKQAIGKNKTTIPQIYRSTPEQYAQFSKQLSKNVKTGITKGLSESGFSNNASQIESVADNIVKRLEQFGKEGKYIDNLGDYVTDLFVNDQSGKIARNVYGYVGRAVDQGLNMAIYDGLGRMARAATGTQMEGVDDQGLAASLSHSAGFAAAISLADFIPGGRKAGAVQDFYRFARHNLKKKRSFSDLRNAFVNSNGKDGLSEKQLRSVAAYFGTLSKKSAGRAGSVSDISAGRGSIDDIVKWLDTTYSSNRKELLNALFKDTGKSLVGSLPRAAIDAFITANYMGMTGQAIINDEAMLGDYLIGAFMAMRSYQPLDPRGQTVRGNNAYRWRYDHSIDAKFNFMEQMGMDTAQLKESIPYMQQSTQEADLISKNLQLVPEFDNIYSTLYEDVEYNPLHTESKSGYQKERAFLNDMNILFTPALLRDSNRQDVNNVDDIDLLANNGEYYDMYNIPDSKVKELWNKVSTVQTSAGKTVAEYPTFDRFMEDFQAPIANFHMDNSLAAVRDFAQATGILTGDTLIDKRNGLLTVRQFDIDDVTNLSDEARYMFRLLQNLSEVRTPDGTQRIKIEPGDRENVTQNITDNAEEISRIAERYHEDVAGALDSSFGFSGADNPSFTFLNKYSNLVNKNRLEDAIFGASREGDSNFDSLKSNLEMLFGGSTVSHRVRYEVQDPVKKDGENELSLDQYDMKKEAQEIIDNLYKMKFAAGQVSNEPGPVRQIPFEDAAASVNFLKSNGFVRNTEFGKMYGDSFFSQIVTNLQRRDFLRLGLDETDYIALRVLQQSNNNDRGEVSLLTNTKDVEGLIRSYLSDDGKFEVSNESVADYVSNYMGVVRRLSKTGKIKEFPNTANITKSEREKMLQSIEYIHELYQNKTKADADSLLNHSKQIDSKLSDIIKQVSDAKTNFDKKKISAEDAVNQVQDAVEKLSTGEDGLLKIVPYSTADFERIVNEVENAKNAGQVDGAFAERLFDSLNEVYQMNDYNSAVVKLANTARSIDTWSNANITLRNKVINELMGKFDREREDLASKNIIELINELTKEAGDFESAKAYIEAIRIATASTHGYSQKDLDYNSEISVSSLREFLDMMSANQERSLNVQSFIQRMKELGISQYITSDGKQISKLLASKMADVENFQSSVREIVNEIKQKDQKRFFQDNDAIVHELFSVAQSVLIRNESREFVSIENGKITRRRDDNVPRTQTMDFIDSMNNAGLRVDELKNEYVENGYIKRISDFGSDYKSIEDMLMHSYRNVSDRASEFVKEQEELLSQGRTDEARMLAAIHERDPDSIFMVRPTFVPLKASDDMGIVFDLTKDNVKKLIEKFNSVEEKMMENFTDAKRIEMWNDISSLIRGSLNKLADTPNLDDANTAQNDLRAAIRTIYVAENFGKDYFWDIVGEDVENQMKRQSKLFKTLHHIDNTNAISLNKQNEKILHTLLNEAGTTSNHKKVAREALRRSNDGVRIAVYNDDADTAGKMIDTLVRDYFQRKYRREVQSGDITASTLEDMANKYIENTLNEIENDGSLSPSISLDNPITDGSVYVTENSMRHDIHVMGKDFETGARASKIAMHSGKEYEKNVIAKMAGRYDPAVSKILSGLGIDYLVPSSQAKLFTGKENSKSIKDYNPLVGFNENIKTAEISKNDIRAYDPEIVKYMFAGHDFDHVSKSNASVTHYWDFDSLTRYSESLNIESTVKGIVNHIESFNKDSRNNDISKLLLQKYKEIKNSGDYSHLGTIEQFITWGIHSNHSLVRAQVMRHVRDLALSDVASRNNIHVSNTFLFSNSSLMNPIFNRENQVTRLGEMNLSSGMSGRKTDGKLAIALNYSDSSGLMTDYVFGRENGKLKRKQTSGQDLLSKDVNENMNSLFRFLLNKDYETVYSVLEDVNSYVDHIKDGKKKENILNLINQSYGDLSNDFYTLAESLANANAGELAIAVNPHKIPKKFGPDSVVNRVKGFVDNEKGNINELNNYEITMQHQADQDGDKITVYGNNPISSLHQSIDNMSFGREATVFDSGQFPLSPNMFNYHSRDGSISRDDNNTRNAINDNNTLAYISQERKSKFVVGSVVKMQGVMTMMNNAGIKHFGESIKNITGTDDIQFSRNYHRVTGSVIQSVLDAWQGVHPAFLDIKTVKDFILFGDVPQNLDISANKLFTDWKDTGGIFGKAINNFSDDASVRAVQKDIVREYMRIFENAYSVFGDSYEGGARTKPSFDILNSVYRDLERIENNDFTSVYRTLRARYEKRPNRSTLVEALDDSILTRKQGRSKESKAEIISIDRKPSTFYPQLIALKGFVTDDRGYIRASNIDDPEMMVKDNAYANKLFRDYNAKIDSDGVTSLLRTDENILNDMVEDLKGFLNSEGKNNLDSPKQLGVYEQVLNAQINTLKRKVNYFRSIKDVDGVRDAESDLSYYQKQLNEIQLKVERLQLQSIESGKAFVHKKEEGRFYNNKKKDPVYAYKINYDSKNGRASYEYSKTVMPGNYADFYSDHVILLNPIKMLSINEATVKEGIAMEVATRNPLQDLYYLTDSKSVKKFNNEVRLIIERAKAHIRNVDSEAYDLIKQAPGLKNDAYEDARLHVDIAFRSMIDSFTKTTDRLIPNNKAEAFEAFSKMLLSPRVVGNSVAKDSKTGIYSPYFKIDNKFVTHLTRYLNDSPDDLASISIKSGMETVFASNEQIDNLQNSIVGKQKSAALFDNTAERMKEYQYNMNEEGSLMRSLERLSGRYYEASQLVDKSSDNVVREEIDGTLTIKKSSNKDGEINNKCYRGF